MKYFRVKNFEKMQYYKKRSPPWICLYNSLPFGKSSSPREQYEFECLNDDSKLHLILIFLLASRYDNLLPYDSVWVTRKIGVRKPVDLDILLNAGFLEGVEHDESTGLPENMHNEGKLHAEHMQDDSILHANLKKGERKKVLSKKKREKKDSDSERDRDRSLREGKGESHKISDDQFEELWKTYPGKSRDRGPKQIAKDMIQAETYRYTFDETMAAVQNYNAHIENPTGEEREEDGHVMKLTTFLKSDFVVIWMNLYKKQPNDNEKRVLMQCPECKKQGNTQVWAVPMKIKKPKCKIHPELTLKKLYAND